MPGPLEGQDLGEGDDPGLGGAVVGVELERIVRRSGCDVDDRATALGERGVEGPGDVERAAEAGVYDTAPLVRGHGLGRRPVAEARSVDQEIEAVEARRNLVDRVGRRDVGNDVTDVGVFPWPQVEGMHGPPVAQEPQTDGGTDGPCATRHDRRSLGVSAHVTAPRFADGPEW